METSEFLINGQIKAKRNSCLGGTSATTRERSLHSRQSGVQATGMTRAQRGSIMNEMLQLANLPENHNRFNMVSPTAPPPIRTPAENQRLKKRAYYLAE